MDRVCEELAKFQQLKQTLLKRHTEYEDIDQYGLILQSSPDRKVGLFITGLMHGDEVVGLEIINHILSEIVNGQWQVPMNFGVLLCNPAAALQGSRFVESDLNRSFLISECSTQEHKRGKQIAPIVERAQFILDIHQTVEPTVKPFFIFQHIHSLIEVAHSVAPDISIVTFPASGFSQNGRTMLEYASSKGIVGIALECGQKGFSHSQTMDTVDLIKSILQKNQRNISHSQSQKIEVQYITQVVKAGHGAALIQGLKNFMSVHKGQVLATSTAGSIVSEHDGHLFFPKYGKLAEVSFELCEVACSVDYKAILG